MPLLPAARRLEPAERPAGHGSGAPHRTDQAGPRWVGVPGLILISSFRICNRPCVLQSFRSNACHALLNRAVYRLCTGGTIEEVRWAGRGGAGQGGLVSVEFLPAADLRSSWGRCTSCALLRSLTSQIAHCSIYDVPSCGLHCCAAHPAPCGEEAVPGPGGACNCMIRLR